MSNCNAAVMCLTQPGRLASLKNCLRLLYSNLLNEFPYPVRIFHEGDVPSHEIEEIQTQQDEVQTRDGGI